MPERSQRQKKALPAMMYSDAQAIESKRREKKTRAPTAYLTNGLFDLMIL